eukprot:1195764-Prorocentrum_minimum.AAC.4
MSEVYNPMYPTSSHLKLGGALKIITNDSNKNNIYLVLDLAEEVHAHDGEDEEEEEQHRADVGERGQRHEQRLEERAQALRLRDEPKDAGHAEDAKHVQPGDVHPFGRLRNHLHEFKQTNKQTSYYVGTKTTRTKVEECRLETTRERVSFTAGGGSVDTIFRLIPVKENYPALTQVVSESPHAEGRVLGRFSAREVHHAEDGEAHDAKVELVPAIPEVLLGVERPELERGLPQEHEGERVVGPEQALLPGVAHVRVLHAHHQHVHQDHRHDEDVKLLVHDDPVQKGAQLVLRRHRGLLRLQAAKVEQETEGGGQEGIYRSSLDARKPQNPTNSEEYQGHLQGQEGVWRGYGGGMEGAFATLRAEQVRRGSGGGRQTRGEGRNGQFYRVRVVSSPGPMCVHERPGRRRRRKGHGEKTK